MDPISPEMRSVANIATGEFKPFLNDDGVQDGDIDGSGVVDFADFLLLSAAFGSVG